MVVEIPTLQESNKRKKKPLEAKYFNLRALLSRTSFHFKYVGQKKFRLDVNFDIQEKLKRCFPVIHNPAPAPAPAPAPTHIHHQPLQEGEKKNPGSNWKSGFIIQAKKKRPPRFPH